MRFDDPRSPFAVTRDWFALSCADRTLCLLVAAIWLDLVGDESNFFDAMTTKSLRRRADVMAAAALRDARPTAPGRSPS